jgi:hypothetical protein
MVCVIKDSRMKMTLDFFSSPHLAIQRSTWKKCTKRHHRVPPGILSAMYSGTPLATCDMLTYCGIYQNNFCSLCWLPSSKLREPQFQKSYFILGLMEKQNSCSRSDSG